MSFFVRQDSIVRKIWGESDTILFIFAGSAAEFAVNKSVDWLYFTGKLPSDPVGRMFSTVSYARRIIFSDESTSLKTIEGINHIHKVVENDRGYDIPAEAYRDVLSMLIDYSISSFELLRRKLSTEEIDELYDVFYRFGKKMFIKDLPESYEEWLVMRSRQLAEDYEYSNYTKDLFLQYKKQLGAIRFFILREGQKLILPTEIRKLLGMSRFSWIGWLVPIYKLSRKLHLNGLIKKMLLPPQYMPQINEMDIQEN